MKPQPRAALAVAAVRWPAKDTMHLCAQLAILHQALLPVDPLCCARGTDASTILACRLLPAEPYSSSCALCHHSCELENLEAHLLMNHSSWMDSALHLLESVKCPTIDCCVLYSTGVAERCPVALNIAFLLASDGKLSDQPRRRDGPDGGCSRRPVREHQHKEEKADGQGRRDIRKL